VIDLTFIGPDERLTAPRKLLETESIRSRGIYLQLRALSGLGLDIAFVMIGPGYSHVRPGGNNQPDPVKRTLLISRHLYLPFPTREYHAGFPSLSETLSNARPSDIPAIHQLAGGKPHFE
jgi:hypothetical protein